jgi:hypothetical protein
MRDLTDLIRSALSTQRGDELMDELEMMYLHREQYVEGQSDQETFMRLGEARLVLMLKRTLEDTTNE